MEHQSNQEEPFKSNVPQRAVCSSCRIRLQALLLCAIKWKTASYLTVVQTVVRADSSFTCTEAWDKLARWDEEVDFPTNKCPVTFLWLLNYIRCLTAAFFSNLSFFSLCPAPSFFSHHISPRVSLKTLNNAQRVKGLKGLRDGSLSFQWSCC